MALAVLCLPAGIAAGVPGAASGPRWALPDSLDFLRGHLIARQVRIEQRVVVRIAPQRMSNRQELVSQAFEREIESRYQEKRIGKCIPLEGIAGVQTAGGNRIVLFLRDARIISASLDKSCHARNFYSGFYVERHQDGRLCAARDQLQARTGAKCEIERLRELVEIAD